MQEQGLLDCSGQGEAPGASPGTPDFRRGVGPLGSGDGDTGLIPQSLHSMLGLCQRAGKAASGDMAVDMAVRKGKAKLLILAEDASVKTQEKYAALTERFGVPCYRLGTRDQLGAALGKAHRAAVAVLSDDFARGIVGLLKQGGLAPLSVRGWSGGNQDSHI